MVTMFFVLKFSLNESLFVHVTQAEQMSLTTFFSLKKKSMQQPQRSTASVKKIYENQTSYQTSQDLFWHQYQWRFAEALQSPSTGQNTPQDFYNDIQVG